MHYLAESVHVGSSILQCRICTADTYVCRVCHATGGGYAVLLSQKLLGSLPLLMPSKELDFFLDLLATYVSQNAPFRPL